MASTRVPPHAQKMLGEATMHYAYREFQQALQLLLEVVRICPGLPHPYQTLGLIYEEVGQHKKALRLFMMAAHLSKRDAQQWRHLATLSAEHGERSQAIYCLGKVLALTPDEQPMAAYLKPLEPWLGFSLSYLPYGVTFHNSLARAAVPATTPTEPAAATGTTTVNTAASGPENVIDGASGTTLIAAAPAEPEHPLTAAAKALEGALEGKKSE